METKTLAPERVLKTGYLPNNGWCIFEPNERGTAKEIIDWGFGTVQEAEDALTKLKGKK